MSALPAEEPLSGAVPADKETMTRRLRSHPDGAVAQSPPRPAAADAARQHAGEIWAGPRSRNLARPIRPLFPEGSLLSPNGTWRLPDKEWLFPDGDRVFPGGSRIFSGVDQAATGGRRVAAGEGGSVRRSPVPAAGAQRMPGPAAAARRSSRPVADVRRASADASPVPLRLTRRGRVVMAVLAAMVAGGLIVAGASAAQATSGSASVHGPRGGAEQVVVQPGDTLWSIAKNADPGSDTRIIVQEMLDLNRLTGPGIASGQRLWVPRG